MGSQSIGGTRSAPFSPVAVPGRPARRNRREKRLLTVYGQTDIIILIIILIIRVAAQTLPLVNHIEGCAMATMERLNPVERVKAASNYLRGTLAGELAEPTDTFTKDAVQVLKHHGMYQQDDRDLRGKRAPDGTPLGKTYSLMVRVKLPGGRLTASQFLAQLDLCESLGTGTLRITNRQDLQIYGVAKRNIRRLIRQIHRLELTTLGACGDVERNVLCCPAPVRGDTVRRLNQQLAQELSDHLLPRTGAYHEIWLTDSSSRDKQQVHLNEGGEPVEPIYGTSYLPRKFKTAVALPEDNCVDALTNDLAFFAVREGSGLAGYDVLVGGGLGITPSNRNTFPALAQPLCFVRFDQAVALAEAVVKVYRDHGNRQNRKRARLKYLVADWGIERFREEVQRYYGTRLQSPTGARPHGFEDHIGWHEQDGGRLFLGIHVENGRIADREPMRLKTALRTICSYFLPSVRLTAGQSILLTDIDPADRAEIEGILIDHGVKLHREVSPMRCASMACVALPTCPLAITESERVAPGVLDQLEAEMQRLGLAEERLTVRMTGCPNGCARPYNADIGLVGRTKGKYTIYLGGRVEGDRLAQVFQDLVPLEQIVSVLAPVLALFRRERRPGESLGDFCHRVGIERLRQQVVLAGQPD